MTTISSSITESRWGAGLSALIVTGWVNAFFNILVSAAFLVLTPPYGGQQILLKAIGVLMLAQAAGQISINVGLGGRREWARRAAWGLAFLEFFQPPFGTVHSIMVWLVFRRPQS